MDNPNKSLFRKRLKSGYIDNLVVVFTVFGISIIFFLLGYLTSLDQSFFYLTLITILGVLIFQKDLQKYPSYGKQMYGICVVTSKYESKPKAYQIVIRNIILYFSLGLDMAYLATCKDKQRRIGDLIAGTKVVEISELFPENDQIK